MQDDLTNKAYVPDSHNCFDLRNERFTTATTLNVHGTEARGVDTGAAVSVSALTSPSSSRAPGFKYDNLAYV